MEVVDVAFRTEAMTHLVSSPSEAAKLNIFARIDILDTCLKKAMFLKAFDEGITIEQDPVTFIQSKLGISCLND